MDAGDAAGARSRGARTRGAREENVDEVTRLRIGIVVNVGVVNAGVVNAGVVNAGVVNAGVVNARAGSRWTAPDDTPANVAITRPDESPVPTAATDPWVRPTDAAIETHIAAAAPKRNARDIDGVGECSFDARETELAGRVMTATDSTLETTRSERISAIVTGRISNERTHVG